MSEVAVPLAGVAAAGALGLWALAQGRRARSRARLRDAAPPSRPGRRTPVVTSRRGLAIAAGAFLGALAGALLSEQPAYAAGLACVGASAAFVLEDLRRERALLRVEAQLSDAVDLLVGALRVGSGLAAALDLTHPNLPQPLRGLLEEMARRLRLGDDPQRAFRDLAERVGLPSFRLFALSLSTQWEAGGSLGPALSLVGRSIRDRIALVRRVGTESASALGSVFGIAAITYGIGALMWLWDPRPTQEFLASEVGSALVATAAALQSLGLLWVRTLVRISV